MNLGAEIEASMPLAMNYLIRHYGSSIEEAEDSVQDAALSILRTTKPFEGRSRFRTYFLTAAINAARQRFRSRERHAEETLDGKDFPCADDQLRDYVTAEEHALLIQWINGIPHAAVRMAMDAHYLEDKSVAEISAGLGISIPAVKSRLNRGRKFLIA